MDITSLSNISADLKHSFATLLEHVYSIDMRTQKLVLNMIQLISDHCPVETEVNHHTSNEVNFNDSQQFKMHQNITSEANERIPSVQLPSHKHPIDDTENMPLCDPSASRCHNSDTSDTMLVQVKGKDLHIYHASDKPAGPKVQVTSKDDENVMENIHKKGYPHVVKQRRSRMDLVQNFETESEIAKLRDPLCDITPNSNKKSVSFANDPSNDIIPLDDDVGYVPDSLSPSPRPGLMKFSMSQKHPGSAKLSSGSTKKSPILIDGLDVDQESSENVTPNLPTLKFPSSARRLEMHPNDKGVENKSPEVQFLGEKKLSSRLQDMTKRSENLYNSKLVDDIVKPTPKTLLSGTKTIPVFSSQAGTSGSSFVARDSSTGGKLPYYGPRRVAVPNQLYAGQFVNDRPRFQCNQSEILNYKAICLLASYEHKDAHAVEINRVHCTFKSFGESLKPEGVVSNFVIAVFIRHLFSKPNGHPDISKRHYYFSNIGHPDEASEFTLSRSFQGSKRACPLHRSDMLFYPILFENHWFVFIVDIKDHMFIFLDSYYSKDDQYQCYVRDLLIPHFIVNWNRYYKYKHDEEPVDMKFDEYEIAYPTVPHQGLDNLVDCGIFVMMFLEYWISPCTILTNIFGIGDIPRIRIKIANEMMFCHQNTGMKRLVITYPHERE